MKSKVTKCKKWKVKWIKWKNKRMNKWIYKWLNEWIHDEWINK